MFFVFIIIFFEFLLIGNVWRKQTNKQNQCIIIRNDDEDVLAANHKYDDGSL